MTHTESIYKNYDLSTIEPPAKDTPGYWFIFNGYNLLISDNSETRKLPLIVSPTQLSLAVEGPLHIGTFHDAPCYCCEVTDESTIPPNMSFVELRALYSILEEDLFLLAGRALQLVTWNRNHQFCSQCGNAVEKVVGEMAKKCPKCNLINYPRISPAVITAIIKDDKILLAHNKAFPNDLYSLIAGFVEAGESLEECVAREIMEEVNIRVKNIKYFGNQSWPFPHSMMIGFTAEYESGEIRVDGTEIVDAHWFDRDHLPLLPSPLSIARKIIDTYIADEL